MGMFDNLSPDAMALMAAAGATATPATRVPVPFGYTFGQGVAALPQGQLNYNTMQQQQAQTQGAQLANQKSQLDLQRQQTLQPFQMQAMLGALGAQPSGNAATGLPAGISPAGGAPGAPGGNVPMGMPSMSAPSDSLRDQMIASGRLKFALTGDPTELEKAQQAAYENDPQLAGAKTAAQQASTLFKTANGTYVTGAQLGGGTQLSSTGMPIPASSTITSNPNMSAQGQKDALNELWGDGNPTPGKAAIPSPALTAMDGKPVLPNQTNLFQPDPTGTPKYKTDNTDTGVNQTKIFQEADDKANTAFTSNAQTFQNEQFRLNELSNIYKQVQAGTLTAQNPELANKLAAWGVLPKDGVNDLAGVQTALQNHALQIIQQIKDTNANLGGTPTRTFGSEIANLQEKGEDPKIQPAALHNIIAEATGVVNNHVDMINGWNAIGGLGNRAANGYTMRPDDFARQFLQNHDISDYKAAAAQQMGPFKGMPGNIGAGASAGKTIVKQYISPSTGKTKIVYSDGSQVIQ